MSFSPLARFRNYTVDNLKALLDVYPDASGTMSWDDAKEEVEKVFPGYNRTAYQQSCQFGIEDRGTDIFRVHNYLFTFDDDNLEKYIEFWIKTYYAPNPYVRGSDEPMLIYCEIVKAILDSPGHELKYEDFFRERIGGGSGDILLNAIKEFAFPVEVRYSGGADILYIEDAYVEKAVAETEYIESNLPVRNPKDRGVFFERYSFANF